MNHSRSPLLVIPIVIVASVLALDSHGQDARSRTNERSS